jgi:SAM-dependent methyltransferase
MPVGTVVASMPLSGAKWAAKSEAYATLIAEHLSDQTVWLDVGCGNRLLESDMDPLEAWLASQPRKILGMDVSVSSNRNIQLLVQGSIYDLPFANGSIDLITCNQVVEHLGEPARACAEIFRCLRASGAVVISTPNLLNYGVLGNAIATKLMPEKIRLKIVQTSDDRGIQDIFPVKYAANTMRRLVRLLTESGLRVHKAVYFRQRRPYVRKLEAIEHVLMKVTPNSGLLVCAHKPSA